MSWQSQATALLAASSWRPCVLAGAAWLALRMLRVRHPASRHAVWTAVLAGSLLLPFASAIAPHWKLPWLPEKRASVPALPAQIPLALPTSGVSNFSAPTLAAASARPDASWRIASGESLLLFVYFAGVIAIAAYRAIGWALLRRALSRARAVRGRRVLESGVVLTPVAVGVLHPAVILPLGWRAWSAETKRTVLAHEFAHLRRGDTLLGAMARFAQCVWWFHPLAWLLPRKMNELAELACDAAVVEKAGNPAAYSRVLLGFAEAVNRAGRRVALPGLAMAASSPMERRIDEVFAIADGARRSIPRLPVWLAAVGVPAVCLAATAGLSGVDQQTPEPSVAFEVASVKPAVDPGRVPVFCVVPCTPGEAFSIDHSRVTARFISLERLILMAYGIKRYQFSGPEWARSQRFDIEAKMPDGATKSQVPEMLQALLVERFKLACHRGSKDLPVYALIVGKSGEKLQLAAPDADAPRPDSPGSRPLYTGDGEARMSADGRAEITSGPYGPVRISGPGDNSSRIEFDAIGMPALADVMTPHEDRPVIDMTGLTGKYRIVVPFDLSPPGPGGARGGRSPEDAAPAARVDPFVDGIRTALDKSGLKLEKRTAPVQTIVIDHLEKSSTGN